MKRCPQCEFIYEDDQSHCDMDGVRLIHHAHALPKLQALTTTRSASLDKPKTKSRIFALVATLVLAGVMALVYYVSIRQSSRTTTVAISPAVQAAEPNPEVSPASTSDSAMPVQTTGNETSQPDASTEKASNPAPKTSDAPSETEPDSRQAEPKPSPKPDADRTTRSTSQTRTSNQPTAATAEKDDSKVKSALKKTGRFFKKALPF